MIVPERDQGVFGGLHFLCVWWTSMHSRFLVRVGGEMCGGGAGYRRGGKIGMQVGYPLFVVHILPADKFQSGDGASHADGQLRTRVKGKANAFASFATLPRMGFKPNSLPGCSFQSTSYLPSSLTSYRPLPLRTVHPVSSLVTDQLLRPGPAKLVRHLVVLQRRSRPRRLFYTWCGGCRRF